MPSTAHTFVHADRSIVKRSSVDDMVKLYDKKRVPSSAWHLHLNHNRKAFLSAPFSLESLAIAVQSVYQIHT